MIKSAKYYQESASFLGWGEDSKLDEERIKLIKKFVTGKKVLDIGCGLGFYVDFLNSSGYECVGVDFVAEFINKAKKIKKGPS